MWSWLALILADTAMKAFGFATSNFVDQKQSKDATKMPLLGEMPDMPAGMARTRPDKPLTCCAFGQAACA